MGTRNQHDATSLQHAIEGIARDIGERHAGSKRLLLLGIANGGIVLARRLANRLRAEGHPCGLGTIDISFHRDDIGRHPIPKEFSPTLIPYDVNGTTAILVDDVLYSGRTVKAALDELFDHGRPDKVELAVLVDRGGRRLPLSADYCGINLDVGADDKVIVHLDEHEPGKDSLRVTSYTTSDRKP